MGGGVDRVHHLEYPTSGERFTNMSMSPVVENPAETGRARAIEVSTWGGRGQDAALALALARVVNQPG